MKNKSIRHLTVLAAVSLLAGFCLPTPSRADSGTVNPGWDLFQTIASMTYDNGPILDLGNLQGVPLGTYNFGSGPQNVGLTDTIVQDRKSTRLNSSHLG